MHAAVVTFVIALAAGVLGQSVARHLRIPGIVILLVLGVGLGPDGVGWVEPRTLGSGLFDIVELAVAVILFEGGMNLEWSRLIRSQLAIRRLVTWGAVITGVGATIAAHQFLGWSWLISAMFGSLVTVTGPTVVGPLVSDLRLRPRVATVLEAEGVLIDPIGAILAVLVLEVALAPDANTLAHGGQAVLMQLGFGALMGLLGGVLLGGLLSVRRVVPEGNENIVALATVLLLFVGCNIVVPHSGILAVPVAGVVVGNMKNRVDRDLREFKDQLSVMLIGLLFILLAADVRMAEIQALGLAGALTVATLIFVVRPLNVALCTMGSNLTLRERILVAWVGPRGIVAAAIASISAVSLADAGERGGDSLRALVFLTIAGTVVLAGFTAKPMAILLGVRLPGRDTIGILGVPGLGLMLGEALRDAGKTVVFLDANPQHCRIAEDAGFHVVFGNALEDRTLQRARFELVGTTIGMTGNDALNRRFVTTASERFNVPDGIAAYRREDPNLEVEGMFRRPHDMERWDVRVRHELVVRERWRFVAPPEAGEKESSAEGGAAETRRNSERFVLLLAERGKRVMPITRSYEPKAGDIVSVVINTQEADEARAELQKLGFEPVVEEEAGADEEAAEE